MSSQRPPDELPRSASGRIPQWVIDEANGRAASPTDWRVADSTALLAGSPSPRRRSRGWLVISLLSGALVCLVAFGFAKDAFSDDADLSAANTQAETGADVARTGPPPGLEESPEPIGTPPATPKGGGEFRFSQTLANGQPMTFSPCRPIHYVMRPAHAPKGGAKLVRAALSAVATATGLQFSDDGKTDEPIRNDRPAYQPTRYGDRWAPVLIAWATPDEVPEFSIDVVGMAGASGMQTSDGSGAYVTGTVYLDPDGIKEIRSEQGRAAAKAVILHELGHLVGLDHVPDTTQIMFPEIDPSVTSYQAGDLAGLAQLGSGACQPDL